MSEVVIGAGGLALAADLAGPEDGTPVALFHGGGQTRHSWTGTWRVLVDAGYRACSVDLRGHGDSAWPEDGDYSFDAFAGDVLAVVDSLPSPPILIGASLGGLASLIAVGEAPDQAAVARALVLVDVAHRIEEAGRDRIGEFMMGSLDGFASLDEAADAIAAYNPHRPRPTDLSGLAKNLRQQPDGRWRWHWDPRFLTGRFGSADETRASLLDPGPPGGRGRRPEDPHPAGPGPQQRPAQRGGRPGLPPPRPPRRVRRRGRRRSHGGGRPQRDLQPRHPRLRRPPRALSRSCSRRRRSRAPARRWRTT